MPSFRMSALLLQTTTGEPPTQWGQGNVAITTTGEHDDRKTVSVGTSEEEHTLSTDIVNAGLLIIKNKDDTNYVQMGFATGVYVHRLRPGRTYIIDLEPTIASLFLKANTAVCDVQYHAFEE